MSAEEKVACIQGLIRSENPRPVVFTVDIERMIFGKVPEIAETGMEVVIGGIRVEFRGAAKGIPQGVSVEAVVEHARMGAAFEVEMPITRFFEIHAGEEASAHVPRIAAAVDAGHGIKRVVRFVGTRAVLEEAADDQKSQIRTDAAAEAGQQGEALKVDVRAAVILQRTALQHAEGQPAVAVEADGGVAHGAYALVRGDIAGLNAEREAGEPSFREGLGLGIDHGVVRMGMIGIRRINESLRAVEVERRIVCRRGKFKGKGHAFAGDNHALLLPAV